METNFQSALTALGYKSEQDIMFVKDEVNITHCVTHFITYDYKKNRYRLYATQFHNAYQLELLYDTGYIRLNNIEELQTLIKLLTQY
jgi:hypothetical protein